MPTEAQSSAVLARKYRPRVPAEVIGQNAAVLALEASFTSGRLPQAFIMTGIRGTGKTTLARMIAAAFNCSGNSVPTLTPCGSCPQCLASGRHPDVIEIDAASNTGVDNVREVIEAVRYRPVDARYKIFIIDEVHMLSRPAFNALLKTLEEPPPHAVFILATTELHKVPATVLSRCRRLMLQRVPVEVLSAHLLHICGLENIGCEPEAAIALAKTAEGSVRDALTMLEQAAASAEGTVTRAVIENMLGLCSPEGALSLLEAVFAGRADTACRLANDYVQAGTDPGRILLMLLDLLTALLKYAFNVTTPEPFAVNDALIDRLQKLGGQLSAPTAFRAWQLLAKLYDEISALPEGVNVLEHAIVRLTYASALPSVPQLLDALAGKHPPPPRETLTSEPLTGTAAALQVFPDGVIIKQ